MNEPRENKRPFLFVGTAKAGTTSIYNYLLDHPELYIPKKETFYFLRDLYRDIDQPYPKQRPQHSLVLDEQGYHDLYRDSGDRIRGEIGTGYLFHHEESIPRIQEEFGDEVNILMILRDPVDRAFSSYNHFVKDLHEPLSFEEALDQEADRVKEGWDFMWRHRELGLYSGQVEAYQQAFSNVLVLKYDDLRTDPLQLMTRVFYFLGVEPLKELRTSKQYNPSGKPKSKTIQKLLVHDNPIKRMVRPIVRALMSRERRLNLLKEVRSKNLTDYGEMDEKVRKELSSFYNPDIARLAKLTGMDFSSWSS